MEEALLSWEGRCLSQQQLCSLLEVVCEWFLELQWQSGLWRAVELEQRALAWSFTIIRFLEARGQSILETMLFLVYFLFCD